MLGCALAGTSSHTADKPHAVDGPTTHYASHNHIANNINYSSLDRAAAARNIPKESLDIKPQTQSTMDTELPSSYLRNNTSKRNSLRRERPKRFTELLDSTVVNDHFHQYGTISSQFSESSSFYGPVPTHEDSGLGGLTPDDFSPGYSNDVPADSLNGDQEPMTPMSPPIPLPVVNNHHQQLPYQHMSLQHAVPQHMSPQHSQHLQSRQQTPSTPATPDDTAYNATARPLSRPLQQRKTLPSIIKRPPTIGENQPQQKVGSSSSSSTSAPPKKDEETYIIENGVRRRIKAEVCETPPSPSPSTNQDDDKPKQLPKRYNIEPSNLRRVANRGSLPDVSVCKELKNTVTPREEMSKLSQKRREELLKLQEEEERRRQQEIVLRLTDLKVSAAT